MTYRCAPLLVVLGLQDDFALARQRWASTLVERKSKANATHQRRVLVASHELQAVKEVVEQGSIKAAADREALVLGTLTRQQRQRMGRKYALLNAWKRAVEMEKRSYNSTANHAAVRLQMAEVCCCRGASPGVVCECGWCLPFSVVSCSSCRATRVRTALFERLTEPLWFRRRLLPAKAHGLPKSSWPRCLRCSSQSCTASAGSRASWRSSETCWLAQCMWIRPNDLRWKVGRWWTAGPCA